MDNINVPSYSSLTLTDSRIKAIQYLCDYINRWKPEIDSTEETLLVDADALFANTIPTEQKMQAALQAVLQLEQMYGYTSTTSTNPEYTYVILDSSDKILAGKKVNGDIELFGTVYPATSE